MLCWRYVHDDLGFIWKESHNEKNNKNNVLSAGTI